MDPFGFLYQYFVSINLNDKLARDKKTFPKIGIRGINKTKGSKLDLRKICLLQPDLSMSVFIVHYVVRDKNVKSRRGESHRRTFICSLAPRK